MKDLQWFPPIPEPPAASARSGLGPVVVAAICGLLFLWRGHLALAIIVWAAALLLALAFLSPPLRMKILLAMRWFADGVGRIFTVCVLWPFYVMVFGTIHLMLAVARVDVLGLRLDSDKPSYWQPAAPERKRAKYYDRLFALEPSCPESRLLAGVIAILALLLVLGVSSELILRSMGFGNPILYRVDPRIGYYPTPNQDVHRYGGRIHINAFGMRSRDITAVKPPGTFRILLLGDSTLYGGSYLDQSQIYATRLENLLNQEPGVLPGAPQRVEVLCMGVNAWGPQHELAYAREFGLFHADLVMVMGPAADAYRALHGVEQLPYFVENNKPRLAWEEFLAHLFWEYHLRLTGGGESFDDHLHAREVIEDGIAAWLAIASLARAQGARVDFEFLPNEDEVREGHASEATQRVLSAFVPELKKREIPFSYPNALFRPELRVPKVYHDEAHLDSYGHTMYALYLRERIRKVVAEK
ncbi:MAG: hypothetical protein ABSA41_06335 [Terriglobia bacterium]|jgi:hypothetical protein